MNTRILTRAAAVTLALACTLPTVLPGQTGHRIVVTPYAGAFVPTGKLARFGHNAPSNAGLGLQQRNGLALGANASYWFTDRTGIEVGGMYAFSDAKSLAGPGGGMPGFPAAGTRTAYVLAGSARLMLNILPISERTAVRFGIGPAVIRHDGTAYKADETGVLSGLTDYGAALSLCTKLPLATWSTSGCAPRTTSTGPRSGTSMARAVVRATWCSMPGRSTTWSSRPGSR